MSPAKGQFRKMGGAWLDFWFPSPSLTLLAGMRIGTGMVILYVLIIRSFDLEAQFSGHLLGNPESAGALGRLAWGFSVLNWVEATWWLWTVHLVSIALALAFSLGVFPAVTGAFSLFFHLSYLHRNPAVILGLDGLITVALIYLVLLPCGRRMTVLWWLDDQQQRPPIQLASAEEKEPPWSGLVFRVMQIHLCLLYFQSGLAKLNAGWLTGVALWHPRLVEKGGALAPETLLAFPSLTTLIPYSLALFELFFPVLLWAPRLRYPLLVFAFVVHVSIGVMWEKLPFNLLMVVLIAAFVRPELTEWLRERSMGMSMPRAYPSKPVRPL